MASTPNFNWSTPDNTGLVKNGALDIRTLGDAIDASLVDLKGGTSGQVLKKNSNTDMDFVWSADSAGMTNPMTTTGDTIYSSSGSTPARLGIGSTGQVLTVAGGVPTWATAGGGGSVTKISTTTFSGVSSQNFNGVFTSTYTFYTVLIDNIYNSGASGVDLRFRYLYDTNTEQVTSYYGGFYGAQQNGTYASLSNSNVSVINMGRMNNVSTNSNFYVMNFGGVGNSSVCPTGTVQGYSVGDGPSYGGAIHNETARIYTGFRLEPASGNFAGTVSVYGWSK
jgi:hypothetical protein